MSVNDSDYSIKIGLFSRLVSFEDLEDSMVDSLWCADGLAQLVDDFS